MEQGALSAKVIINDYDSLQVHERASRREKKNSHDISRWDAANIRTRARARTISIRSALV